MGTVNGWGLRARGLLLHHARHRSSGDEARDVGGVKGQRSCAPLELQFARSDSATYGCLARVAADGTHYDRRRGHRLASCRRSRRGLESYERQQSARTSGGVHNQPAKCVVNPCRSASSMPSIHVRSDGSPVPLNFGTMLRISGFTPCRTEQTCCRDIWRK